MYEPEAGPHPSRWRSSAPFVVVQSLLPLAADDVNGNGVADHVDRFAPNASGRAGSFLSGDSPVPADDPGEGTDGDDVRTGLGGTGCSIVRGAADPPTTPLVPPLAFVGLGRRLARRHGRR